jgi:predicted transcriptional regulator
MPIWEGNAMLRTVLMSLKPGPFEDILAGRKLYEYRIRYPREATAAYIYVSGSVRAVRALIRFGAPLSGTARELVLSGAAAPEEEGELDAYFHGGSGCALPVDEVIPLEPVPLRELRDRFPGVSVPQSYYYLESKPRLLAFLQSLGRA